jgi:arsenate reductase-like glutaredoxin family protein
MRTTEMNLRKESSTKLQPRKSNLPTILSIVFGSLLMLFAALPASAHCDSYDGPVIKDATRALETNNVNLVLKWITDEQEQEIIPLFNKTYSLKNGDKEIYAIVEKHFFETLVRLHRETEGAPYTGLKPAGTTKQIIQMTDKALNDGNVDDFLVKLNSHIDKVIREKYHKVAELNKVKDNSKQQGRAFVEAYVDYTHTVEALHDIMEHAASGHTGH